jgi:hypothetical protein
MASKYGSCAGTSGSKYNLWIEYSSSAPDTANNRTYVSAAFKLQRNDSTNSSAYNGYANQNTRTFSVSGVSGLPSGQNWTFDTRNKAVVTIASWGGYVGHDADGKKRLTLSGSFTCGNGPTLTSGSVPAFNWDLPAIARKSSASLSPAAAAMGRDTVAVNISRASASFTHKVTYRFGAASGTIAAAAGTSASWAPPANLAEQIQSAVAGVGSVRVETFSGSTSLGYVDLSVSLTAGPDAFPSFSDLTLTRIDNRVPAAWDAYVSGYSGITAAITGVQKAYGSAITAYAISGMGYSSASPSMTANPLWASSGEVSAYVKDARGRSSLTITKKFPVYRYTPPEITALSVFRCGADGAAQDGGPYFSVTVSWSVSLAARGNAGTASVKLTADATGQTAVTGALQNGVTSLFPDGSGGPLTIDPDLSYTATVTVSDALESAFETRALPTAAVTLNLRANGRGAAFGKVSEYDDALESAWPVRAPRFALTNGPELLWSGSVWGGHAGTLAVKNADRYSVFLIDTYGDERLIGFKVASGAIRASGNTTGTDGNAVLTYVLKIERVSHDPATGVTQMRVPAGGADLAVMTNSLSFLDFQVTAIYGII